MRRRSESPYSAAQLAEALRFEGLERAAAIDGDTIAATFVDESTAAVFCRLDMSVFDLGPYELVERFPGGLRLRARADAGMDRIDIVEVPAAEEWRRLMARDLDVVPATAEINRQELADMTSLRPLDIPVTGVAALVFNLRAPPFSETKARRAVTAALDRAALARTVCGAIPSPSTPPSSRRWASGAPATMQVMVLRSDSTLTLAAEVLRLQLRSVGTIVTIDTVSIDELAQRTQQGRFEATLVPCRSRTSVTSFPVAASAR